MPHECNQIAEISRIEVQIEELTRNMNSLAEMVKANQEWQIHHERHASERFEKLIRYGITMIGTLAVGLLGFVAPMLSNAMGYIDRVETQIDLLDTRLTAHENKAFAHIPDKTHD